MSPASATSGRRRALVLGGGGITGIAWEVGMLAGLAEAGVDLSLADLVVGTSAGSVVGALLLSGRPVEELYQDQLAPLAPEVGAKMGPGILLGFMAGSIWPRDELMARARMGRRALTASSVPEEERRRIIAEHLPRLDWPRTPLRVTAVDAESGEFKVFDSGSGVPLAEAVAASCAVPLVWPPITIGGRRYMDGGARSIANADLATGCGRVVVLAPVPAALRRSGRIPVQLARLGPDVRSTVVGPDRRSRRAIGYRVLSPARRAPAAQAGREQAALVVEQVRRVWDGSEPSVKRRRSPG